RAFGEAVRGFIHQHASSTITSLMSALTMLVITLIILIGLSRVYLGVHYPSDVLAGYAAALIWVCTTAFGDHLLHRKGKS
ncbi:MAG TPA: phosphatase PAP2 family protein, partial [Pyrinomonadaceae bacterium]|nr:phosphatase PAP2 family protein [Pyrinomonadaceae bacterium]